jgi:hypothetical protein
MRTLLLVALWGTAWLAAAAPAVRPGRRAAAVADSSNAALVLRTVDDKHSIKAMVDSALAPAHVTNRASEVIGLRTLSVLCTHAPITSLCLVSIAVRYLSHSLGFIRCPPQIVAFPSLVTQVNFVTAATSHYGAPGSSQPAAADAADAS